MVITPDFESGNRGSSPRGTLSEWRSGERVWLITRKSHDQNMALIYSSLAQLAERAAVNSKVTGSNPVGGASVTLV